MHLSAAAQWWDEWQLRILVLGSLGLQWFLVLAAPMRKYMIPSLFRKCIGLAYSASDALAIYALATLFNRHARGASGSNKASILEVLWAPILLNHLGGQHDMGANNIEDSNLWLRQAVTLVSQVTISLYAFYKSWPISSDDRLLVSAILLFVIGIISFCERPWALYRARINSQAGMMKSWQKSLLSERAKIHMILSDMSLYAAAKDLNQPLKPLDPGAEVSRLLRSAFGLTYTRANVATTPAYLVYHLLLLPSLHTAAIALFATIPKHGYGMSTDVKVTYILICLTAALDLLAVFVVRGLIHLIMLTADVPALCETIPEYNLITSVIRRMRPCTGSLLKCAMQIGFSEEYFDFRRRDLYRMVIGFFAIDVVNVANMTRLDLSTYRSFSEGSTNWALGDDLRKECGAMIIKRTLRSSFDKSVLTWHIATDLCFRRLLPPQDRSSQSRSLSEEQLEELSEEQLRQLCTQAISNYLAHLLNFRAEMLMTGSRQHLFTRASQHMERILEAAKDIKHKLQGKQQLDDADLGKIKDEATKLAYESNGRYTLIHDACKLAEELIGIQEDDTRWRLMYRVWVGMLCYSASMCRGYLHAKSLGEGGEFLSVVWLIVSIKGAKTLADKLQMPEPEDGDDDVDVEPLTAVRVS